MSNEPNEDLIEATIRRVAEARAARERELDRADPNRVLDSEQAPESDGWQPQETPAPDGETPSADDPSIEETIRRVQAQSAGTPPPDGETPPTDEDPSIEETIRRVQAQATGAPPPAAESGQGGWGPPDMGQAPATDEQSIEETIRRVQEQAASATPPAGVGDETSEDDDPIAETVRRVQAQAAANQQPDVEQPAVEQPAPEPEGADERLIEETIRRVQAHSVAPPQQQPDALSRLSAQHAQHHDDDDDGIAPALAYDAGLAETVARLQRELAQMNEQLHALTRRIDALSQAATPTLAEPEQDDPDSVWQQTLRSSRVTPLQQRPSVFRDPSPQTATAEQLQPELQAAGDGELDTRPIPEPLPPLHAQPRRGLELLPRTYRITVEDKRRGVDLVPLHRALLGIEHVRDMSLLSYNNGVAIVALDMVDELDPEVLRETVAHAMSRDARVEVHNESTMVVKLADA